MRAAAPMVLLCAAACVRTGEVLQVPSLTDHPGAQSAVLLVWSAERPRAIPFDDSLPGHAFALPASDGRIEAWYFSCKLDRLGLPAEGLDLDPQAPAPRPSLALRYEDGAGWSPIEVAAEPLGWPSTSLPSACARFPPASFVQIGAPSESQPQLIARIGDRHALVLSESRSGPHHLLRVPELGSPEPIQTASIAASEMPRAMQDEDTFWFASFALTSTSYLISRELQVVSLRLEGGRLLGRSVVEAIDPSETTCLDFSDVHMGLFARAGTGGAPDTIYVASSCFGLRKATVDGSWGTAIAPPGPDLHTRRAGIYQGPGGELYVSGLDPAVLRFEPGSEVPVRELLPDYASSALGQDKSGAFYALAVPPNPGIPLTVGLFTRDPGSSTWRFLLKTVIDDQERAAGLLPLEHGVLLELNKERVLQYPSGASTLCDCLEPGQCPSVGGGVATRGFVRFGDRAVTPLYRFRESLSQPLGVAIIDPPTPIERCDGPVGP